MGRNFLVAFDGVVGSERYEKFTEAFRHAMASVGQEGFYAEQIDFVVSKGQVDESLKTKEYQVFICFEKLQNTSIGQGTVRVWMQEYPDLKIILAVDTSRKSSGKMKGLFDRGYYDAVYFEDFKPIELMQIVLQSRTREEAWEYYGLDMPEKDPAGFARKNTDSDSADQKERTKEADAAHLENTEDANDGDREEDFADRTMEGSMQKAEDNVLVY
ncbi:MAG: hypothetical protein NC489_43145 [Ruminococcus flavefaciens]|nr:hypothetical protein [Ruminococcus flavefaciens]